MEKRRLFVAIDLPQEVINEIIAVQQQLSFRHLFEGRITHLEHLHLTLKFIGEVDEQTHIDVQKALENLSFPAITSSLGHLGSFKGEEGTSIIWIALEGEELAALAHAINEILAPLLPADQREFVSHVTIARVKSVPDEERLQKYLEDAIVPALQFELKEFTLKDSVISDNGSYYTVIERYPLVS
jgi:2'-5' RNA ligase